MKKKKILGVLLTVSLISSALGSCGKDVPSNSQDIIVPEITETTEIIETLAPTQATEDDTTEQSTEAKSDFDFEKTLEQTYICGQKLSYPLTWGQFGEDFTIISDSVFTYKEEPKVTADVDYKGHYLGHFIFYGSDSVDAINEDTLIRAININRSDMDFFGTSKITINGLSFGADHSRLFEALGDDFREGVGYDQIVYENDYGKYIFRFGMADDEDKIISVNLYHLAK